MPRTTQAVLSLLLLTVSSCVPTFDDDLTRIERPRIIAVRSVPAEAKPGEQVELSALVADVVEAPDSVGQVKWALCLAGKPLTELGPVNQDCMEEFGRASAILQPLGRGQRVTATLPTDGCRTFGPLGPPASDEGETGRPYDPDPSGGYYQPVILGNEELALASPRLDCGVAGVTNSASIRFETGYRPNENPEVEALEWSSDSEQGTFAPLARGDEETSVPAGAKLELRVRWPSCPRDPSCGDGLCTVGENQVNCGEDCLDNPRGCTGAEDYLAGDAQTREVKDRREGIQVAWFATAGTFSSAQTARLENERAREDSSNSWTAPAQAGPVRLWVVLRDDRGGVGWKEYRLRVTP